MAWAPVRTGALARALADDSQRILRAGPPDCRGPASAALFRQSGQTQRAAKGFRERRGTVHTGKLAAVAKRRVKLEHARSRGGGFVQPAELGERSGQLDVSYAVCGIGLTGFVSGPASLLVTAAQQMAHGLCIERRPGP